MTTASKAQIHDRIVFAKRSEKAALAWWKSRVGRERSLQCEHTPTCETGKECDKKRINRWRREGRL